MKFKGKIFIIALIMFVLLCVSSVCASENETLLGDDDMEVLTSNEEEIQLDSQEDEVVNSTPQDVLSAVSFEDFQSFIDSTEEGGTFKLTYDVHRNYGETTIVHISKSITIEGSGNYITNMGNHGILEISDKYLTHDISVTIKNLKFYDGVHNGGAIYVESDRYKVDLTIIDCEFRNNKGYVYGGAILFDGGTEDSKLTVRGSSFIANEATEKSFFTTAMGGAIASHKGVMELVGCSFSGNRATGSGGAIYSVNDVIIDGCDFYLNHADNDGGAIYTKGALKWGNNPSDFTENYVSADNTIEANKGGAIYADTIENTVKGTFLNNRAWYGGAIYVNAKCHVNIESSKFEGNAAKKASGSSGCGAAIYMDSASALLTLRYNIFINNQAPEDLAVYNCGKYESVEYNWWGSNDPDFTKPYLVEWHRIGSNAKHSDGHPLKIVLTSDKDRILPSEKPTLTLKFMADGTMDLTDRLNGFDVNYKSNKEASFNPVGKNKTTVYFTPRERGDYLISAQVNDQVATTHIWVRGDFDILQELVNNADVVLNLERDFTYSVGVDRITGGILIDKPLTVNGNGHTINALAISRIFNIVSDGVVINDINIGQGKANSGGAILLNNACNFIISDSKIFNSDADMGAAIYLSGGNNSKIVGCTFENDISKNSGGAVYIATPNSRIENSRFDKNIAEYGGAVYVSSEASNLVVNNCKFNENVVNYYGSAMLWNGTTGAIENSTFRLNKAGSRSFVVDIDGYYLTGTFKGYEHYINSIYSDIDLSFSNITYDDHGQWKNTNNPIKSDLMVNETISMIVYDAYGGHVVKQLIFKTNESGQIRFETYELESGNYTYWMANPDSAYYHSKTIVGRFNVTHDAYIGSSVEIYTENKKEFEYGHVMVEFYFENKTDFRVLVRNHDCTQVIYDEIKSSDSNNYFDHNLLPSDDYYNITVYNLGNSTCRSSHDSILFKVIKEPAYIQIESSPTNITYATNASIMFRGESGCHSYRVTIYDSNNETVYSEDILVETIWVARNIPLLDVGEYNITVTNLGNELKRENSVSDRFRVVKATTNFNVTVDRGVFNKATTVTVNAEIDGVYTVIINSTVETLLSVEVVGGRGISEVELDAGFYSANVTFGHKNYNDNATNATFTIDKAQSNVGIEDFGNVVYNQSRTIRFTDFYPVKYNVTIYNPLGGIEYSVNSSSLLFKFPVLMAGQYNLIVINLGNDNVIGSQSSYIFDVVMDNHVEVFVDDAFYGRELLIKVVADMDGFYYVDINGTIVEVDVVNRTGFNNTLQLPAGDYSANVTFDDPDYTHIITNTTFTVFPSESNIQIYEIGEVPYGEDIELMFYDDFPTVFVLEVLDMNGENVMDVTFDYEEKGPEMMILLELPAGEYNATLYNLGNDNVSMGWDSILFNVTKLTPNIQVDCDDVIYPDVVVVYVLVDVNGTYVVSLAGQKAVVDLTAGEEYSVVFSDVEVGNYTILVSYDETENYTAAINNEVTVEVFDFEFDIDTEDEDENTTLIIKVPDDAKGKIIVTANGQNYTSEVINGTAVVTIPNLKVDDEILISFISDDRYPNKTQNTTEALINSKILSQNMNRGYNSGTDFQATLMDGLNRPISNATVTVTINGKKYSFVTDENGVITINQKLAVGTYTITLTNPFNNGIKTNTLKILTRITGNKNVNTYYGKNYQYKLRIIGDDGSPVGAGIEVRVTVNGKVKTLKTDKNGYITFKFTKTYLPKTYTVAAEYKGVKVSNKVVVKKVLTLKKVKVKRSAKKLKLTATLKEGKKALKGKKVVFKFKGKKYTAKTNKKGVAKVIIKSKVLKRLKAGKKVTYQVTYLKNTIKRTVKVKR